MLADCRKCIYFHEYVNKSGGFLGFCEKWRKQITYYVGRCRGFTPKPNLNKKLTDFYSLKLVYGAE